MNIEKYRDTCLSFPGTTEDLPFDDNTLCFKVMGKVFSICDIEEFESINLNHEPRTMLLEPCINICLSPGKVHNL